MIGTLKNVLYAAAFPIFYPLKPAYLDGDAEYDPDQHFGLSMVWCIPAVLAGTLAYSANQHIDNQTLRNAVSEAIEMSGSGNRSSEVNVDRLVKPDISLNIKWEEVVCSSTGKGGFAVSLDGQHMIDGKLSAQNPKPFMFYCPE